MDHYYLKGTTKIEPLIWRWYAWPHLISPATAACNIVDRHLKIMQSYVQNPLIHAQAVKDPKLIGGPFIDLNGEYINQIRDLIENTKEDCKELIFLNNSLKEFDQLLQNEATGDSLEKLYARLPNNLKGLVELVYDLNNHPSMRLIEPLIYKTHYSDKHQSIVLSEMLEDHRQFSLSTPRLDRESEVYLDLPFSDLRLDELFSMRTIAKDLGTIKEMFNISSNKQKLFDSFFISSTPLVSPDRNYDEEGVRVRYFGHACVLLQTASVSILIDATISYPLPNVEVQRFTFSDLPDYIDYVLITHNHQDHLMFETLLQLRYKIGHIIFPSSLGGSLLDPSIKHILKHVGFNSLIEMKEMETLSLDEVGIIGLPSLGEHSDLNIQSKLSYFIELKGKKFLFAADSNCLDPYLYDHIFDVTGKLDMLFLGMECEGAPLTWLYGPLLTQPLKRTYDRNRTLSGSNCEKAKAIMEKSKCSHAYVYAMGQEPWLNYVMALKYSESSPQIIESDKFVKLCKERGVESERLFGKKEWVL